MAAYLPAIMGGVQSGSGVSASAGQFYANKNNAKAAKYEGQSAMAVAQVNSDRIARNNRLLTERQFAGFSGAGVDASQGTPLDVMTADAVQGELDALMAQYEGRVFKQQSDFEAKQYKFQAKNNKFAGIAQAIFDPAGHLLKLPQFAPKAPAVKAPEIQPGGGSRSNVMTSSPEAGSSPLY